MNIDWHELAFGKEDGPFLISVAGRTFVMFLIILVGLRVLGKRGVKQLSVYELGVIIGLGSAAGDPMFYRDVGIVVCVVVFAMVLALYRLLEVVTTKNERLGKLVEGEPVEVLREGALRLESFDREPFSEQELFMQLRLNHVSHLGQVRCAILEPSGEISTFFFDDDEVIPGLPILPDTKVVTSIDSAGDYACARCGRVDTIAVSAEHRCPACKHATWAPVATEKRIT